MSAAKGLGRIGRFLGPVVVITVLGVLGWSLLRPADPNAKGSPLIGHPAPDFKLATLQGGMLRRSSLNGKPLIVNFWASWCIPCREEAPLLRDTQSKYASKDLVIVGITVNDKPEDSRKFAKEFSLNYPNLIDPNGKTGVDYGVRGVPETYFLDRKGIVRFKKFGPIEAKELEQWIGAIL